MDHAVPGTNGSFPLRPWPHFIFLLQTCRFAIGLLLRCVIYVMFSPTAALAVLRTAAWTCGVLSDSASIRNYKPECRCTPRTLFCLLQRNVMRCHVSVHRCVCIVGGCRWILFVVRHMSMFSTVYKVTRCDIFVICYCELRVFRVCGHREHVISGVPDKISRFSIFDLLSILKHGTNSDLNRCGNQETQLYRQQMS